jgi:hypothetical protein
MTAKDLIIQIFTEFPESNPKLTDFPSGAFMIDIQINNVSYVAEYVVGQGYGFSKTREATFGWEGVEKAFQSIDQLADHIFNELRQKRK